MTLPKLLLEAKNLRLIGYLTNKILSGDFHHTRFLRPGLILRHKLTALDSLIQTNSFASK